MPVTSAVGGTRQKQSMIATVTNQGKTHWMIISCRIPDDCIDSRRYPLFMGRAVMQELIKGLKTQAKAQIKRSQLKRKTVQGIPS